MRRYQVTRPWELEPQPAEVRRPGRSADLVGDLLVPLAQAVVTGAFVGGLALVLLAELAPAFDGDRFAVWGIVALTVATGTWLLLLVDTRRLLWGVEKLTGLDLNRDGAKGKPQERVIVVNAAQGQRQAEQRARTERQSQFASFVAGIPVNGTALRAWESELGRDTYQEYRDILIRVGWARWCSTRTDGTPAERQGWELVKPVGEILERISG